MSKLCVTLSLSNILIVLILSISAGTVLAQDSADTVDCRTAPRLQRRKNVPVVSFGVINGKAVVLVKPDFPPVARAVNVSGSVDVSVLIDPRGCVAEAKVVSGHILLRQASQNAALRSSFEPINLGGKTIWFMGTIVYNYRLSAESSRRC